MNNLPHTSLLILLIFFIIPSQSEEPVHYSCDNSVANATVEISNIIGNLLPTLVNLTKQYGSSMAQNGTNETRIYALAQCRGDAPNATCSTCIDNAIQVVRSSNSYCRMQSGAEVWYNYCFLKYSISNFYGEVAGGLIFYNTATVTKYTKEFNETLTTLMNQTTWEALASEKGFGKGELKVPRDKTGVTIYGLLQCNKDLLDPAYKKCPQCLSTATNYIFSKESACKNRPGCRLLFEGCFLQYEIYNFFYDGGGNGSSVGKNYERVAVVDVEKN